MSRDSIRYCYRLVRSTRVDDRGLLIGIVHILYIGYCCRYWPAFID